MRKIKIEKYDYVMGICRNLQVRLSFWQKLQLLLFNKMDGSNSTSLVVNLKGGTLYKTRWK